MMLGLGIGAYGPAIFHLFTHAYFKASLFLGSGSLHHSTGTFNLKYMGGMRKIMPYTYWSMIIGSLSLAGIFPLSGLSYGKSVYCNENGNWSVLPNDIYGFNNPPEIYNKKIDVVILGDSFARGACLKIENSTAGYIRNYTNFNTTALANGGGPLIELATFIEYAAKIKPKYVFWFFYEGNDHENLLEEKNIPILMKYLDSNYEQNLILKQ